MDDARFDALAKSLGQRPSRRSLLKGLLGLGGAAAVTTLTRAGAEAQWSVPVCLPDGAGGYTQRLVPKAAVTFYVNRYGAVLPENGVCPACQPGNDACNCEPLTIEVACTGAVCGETRDRGCGITTICEHGSCDVGSVCGQSLEDGSFFCAVGSPSDCPELSRFCTDDSSCRRFERTLDVCREGHCGRCWTDADCQPGGPWRCMRNPACAGGNGSGWCGAPLPHD